MDINSFPESNYSPESKKPEENLEEENLEIEAKRANIEKRRQIEIESMLESKAVEITDQNFDFELLGAPQIFDTTAYTKRSKLEDKREDINFYQMWYSGDEKEKELSLTRRYNDKIYYIYRRQNLISNSHRGGSFFAMSVELNDIYCTDFEKVERFMDLIFEKIIVDKYKILEKINNTKYSYRYNIPDFRDRATLAMTAEIKNIILKNFNNKDIFGGDFRKTDENFKNVIRAGGSINLHSILKITKYIDAKGVEKTIKGGVDDMDKDIQNAKTKETVIEESKPLNSNFFDFDRNIINAKYDQELAELEKE